MKYLKKYNESNIIENDIDFIITKIKEKYPKEEVNDKADLIDMICWFETEFEKDIVDEDKIIHQLGIEYGLKHLSETFL